MHITTKLSNHKHPINNPSNTQNPKHSLNTDKLKGRLKLCLDLDELIITIQKRNQSVCSVWKKTFDNQLFVFLDLQTLADETLHEDEEKENSKLT